MGKGIFTPNFEQEFLRIESRLIRTIKQGTMKKIVNKDEDSVHTYVSPFGFYKSFYLILYGQDILLPVD